jgi:hypothetical protein
VQDFPEQEHPAGFNNVFSPDWRSASGQGLGVIGSARETACGICLLRRAEFIS